MDRAGCLWRAVAANASRKRELFEEVSEAGLVFALIGINFGVRSLEIYRTENSGCTVSRACKKDHVQSVFLDQAHEVKIGECQTRAGSPVSQKTVLDVLRFQGFLKQRIALQVDHAERQVVAGAPVGV